MTMSPSKNTPVVFTFPVVLERVPGKPYGCSFRNLASETLRSQIGAGVCLVNCNEGGLFRDAGCASGDVILSIDGESISRHEVASTALAQVEIGSTITLRVAREMVPPRRMVAITRDKASGEKLGLTLLANDGGQMVSVSEAHEGYAAANAGVLRGDKIISVNGVRMDEKSKEEIVALLAQHGAVLLEVETAASKLALTSRIMGSFSRRVTKPAAVSTGGQLDSGLEVGAGLGTVPGAVPANEPTASCGGDAALTAGAAGR